MDIQQSISAYEQFLRCELGEEVIEEGFAEKREKMAADPFRFLRATYWRWAETIQGIAGELSDAPRVLAVGDVHLENFGTWRDADGRLVWGINDYDEAAEMPYPIDILRLATSALLACPDGGPNVATIAGAILAGYGQGLSAPKPFILDRELGWLRQAVIVPEGGRDEFWTTLEKKRKRFEKRREDERPRLPRRYQEALLGAMPPRSGEPEIWYRSAGLGSLGRPRWVARAQWCGDWIVREAKGIVPSAWGLTDRRTARAIRCMEISTGRYRAPDPWFRITDGIAVRRLSPNSRKFSADTSGASSVDQAASGDGSVVESRLGLDVLLSNRMLEAMGRELAAVHLGGGIPWIDIQDDLQRRPDAWLAITATKTAEAIRAEQEEFRADWRGTGPD